MSDTEGGRGSFWSTLPGLLTGIAAVIGAGTAAIIAIRSVSTSGANADTAQHPVQRESAAVPKTVIEQRKFTGPMGPLEMGVSYNQGDIYESPAGSAQDCATMCANDDRCVAVTYVVSQKRCWVKNKTLSTSPSSDMVSSRKLIQ